MFKVPPECLGLGSALALRRDQPRLVNEGQQRHPLPLVALAVHIKHEVDRVGVEDGRGRVEHQLAEGGREELRRLRRQHGQQLRQRREGAARLELHAVTLELGQVARERRVEVGVVP